MNRIAAIALFVVAGFATTHRASAQTGLARATVPFAFTVNDTTLPAGKYVVTAVTPNLLKIQSTDHDRPFSAMIVANEGTGMKLSGSSRLVFEAYGDQYFLHEIVSPANSTDALVSRSKREKQAGIELAGKKGGQPVLFALN